MRRTSIGAVLIAAVTAATMATTHASPDKSGDVYSATNSAAGNQVLVFDRSADGSLEPAGTVATGGNGSGNGLGNQGGVVLTNDGKYLLVINAGSNDVSVLEIDHNGLALRDREPSGGLRPISVTVSARLVYVLNNGSAVGGSDSISGFRLSRDGDLTKINGSTRALSAPTVGPAEVELSPDGASLIVTEKATNRVDIFAIEDNGVPGAMMSYASSGQTPFGFAFGKHDQFFVSEAFGGAADASAASSYQVTGNASFTVVSPSVPTKETAACWVAVSPDGKYLYATNAGSGTVSGFRIRPDGSISRLDANGVTGITGPGVSDVTITGNGRYLYALRSGAGAIAAFRIEEHGALTPIATTLIPPGANGIAAR